MKFYLSSYKLGNETDKLKELIPKENKKTAYIPNALDFSDDEERRRSDNQADIEQLKKMNLDVEIVDLRDYFNNQDKLEKKLNEFGVIWVRGGNVFVLRQAIRLSGFDAYFYKSVKKADLLYGGYSAGICILAPTLKGLDIMDDSSIKPYPNCQEVIWSGLEFLNYTIIPHYKSHHPDSKNAQKAAKFMMENKIPFKTLKDGEVIIIE